MTRHDLPNHDLPNIVEKALRNLGGNAPIAAVAREIWAQHEQDLRSSGDILYTWQYDMRWAAQKLRDAHKLTYSLTKGRRVWQLV